MKCIPETRRASKQGFALVITVSLLVLLALVALGMLTLSSITVRASSLGAAKAEARANARLALMMALGELQKHAGPDKAVTATSGIVSEAPAKRHLAGVWQSWDFDPAGNPPDYAAEKSSRFRSWLVSASASSEKDRPEFATTDWSGDTIELVGEGALGATAPDESRVVAGRVPVSVAGAGRGGYAWHVSDESVKARINLYRDPDLNETLARKCALLAGHRPEPSVMREPGGGSLDFLPDDGTPASFGLCEETDGKITDLEQVDLLPVDGNGPGRIKPFRHDVTPYSLGLLTDVRRGGLKQDLTSIFERASFTDMAGLPAEFRGRGLYESTHGITGVSDPNWGALASYYNTYKVLDDVDTNPVFAQPPTRQLALDEDNPGPQENFYPGPVIQKVEMMFSIVVRDTHSGATKNIRDNNNTYPFLGHLAFTPIITLHNPYNVNISFDEMKVTMDNIPVAFRIYLDDRPINTRLLNLSYYFFQNHRNGRSKTDFTIRIADWKNWNRQDYDNIDGPIVMKPGQSLVCSPYLDPSYTWRNIRAQYITDLIFKEDKGRKAKPGYYGRCFGFDSDVIRPKYTPDRANNIQTNTPPRLRNSLPYFALRDEDDDGHADGRLRLECAIRQPVTGSTFTGIDDSRFDVRAQVTVDGEDYDYGGLRFSLGVDDDNPNTDLFQDGIFPEVHSTDTFAASEAYVPDAEPISDHASAKTFCVFSAYARTTSGGVYDNGSRNAAAGNSLRDGRIAGMPYLFHNPARPLALMDLARERPGAHSHELNVQVFHNLGQVEDYFNQDALNRTACLTGNTTQRGIKSGSYLEVPVGPMQTIADFRRSNALTSSYLPNDVQPVGNSRISPILTTSTAKGSDPDVAAYELLDHSLLANHALYDGFYFSTFATEGGLSPGDSFQKFMDLEGPLLSQAFQPYVPVGETAASARDELFNGGRPKEDAYRKAAAYQMVKGPFNVNSTSVQAWKARLAAVGKDKVYTLWAKNAALEELVPDGIPVLPMALGTGGPVGGGGEFAKIDDSRTNDWNGHRELSEEELDRLATSIVDEVRERGPFLSMSEFVNRRLGPDSELTRMGALEAAIDEAEINEVAFRDQVPVTARDLDNAKIYDFSTPLASVGNPAAGAPGWVSQGDLMRLLEPAATVRSDTFVIRVYGEARDAAGKVTATAYAEAVVQRLPEYLDGADSPTLHASSDPGAAPVNKMFGRRFGIVSFRWLNRSEI